MHDIQDSDGNDERGWYDERRSSISSSGATQCTSSTIAVDEPQPKPRTTNYVSITRLPSATSLFRRLLEGTPKIVETFHIDPHLKVPDGILQARLGTMPKATQSGTSSTLPARSNASLRVVNGWIDVMICLIADNDPLSSFKGMCYLWSWSRIHLHRLVGCVSESGGVPGAAAERVPFRPPAVAARRMMTNPGFQLSNTSGRTTLDVDLITDPNGWHTVYPGRIRIVAPLPRPPFILRANCTSLRPPMLSRPTNTQEQLAIDFRRPHNYNSSAHSNSSPSPTAGLVVPSPSPSPSHQPLTVRLPRSFRGLLTLRIGSGDINKRVWLSKAVEGRITFRDEAPLSLACFLGELDGVELLTVNGGEWMGDQADLKVEEGRLRVVFEDEE